VPHLVLTTPITWYLERALQEWQWLTVYLLLGAIGINLPLPLYSSVYVYPIFDEPPEETLPHLPDILLGIVLLPAYAAHQLLTQPLPTGLTNALTLLFLSPLGYYLPVPDSIAALLALPSALEHLVALLLAPALLLEGARTEFKIALEVGPRTGRGECLQCPSEAIVSMVKTTVGPRALRAKWGAFSREGPRRVRVCRPRVR